MGTSSFVAALIMTAGLGAGIPDSVQEKQEKLFKEHLNKQFVWKYDKLPAKAKVPKHRTPYSGYIYPDTAGGCFNALKKYDAAFNGGRYAAAAHERWDTTAYTEVQRRGLFGFQRVSVIPYWHGHCNGWTSATIRHAQPQKSVTHNGIVFSPADIKSLLAEIYIYNDIVNLCESGYYINAGNFHAVITNWVGRAGHPLGMEADPSAEKWNYPIYAYESKATKYGNDRVDVQMTITYAKDDNDGEDNKSKTVPLTKYFHYQLQLDEKGNITGGYFYRDSSRIDLVWLPLRPKESKAEGNERGNPHVDIDQVLAIWRASVSELHFRLSSRRC